MAMNKKEKEQLEQALTTAALRWTAPVLPDVPPPEALSRELTTGFLFNAYSGRVEVACSSSLHHSYGRSDETTAQGACNLYSSKMLALMAMRHEVEKECAKKLRNIDKQIEAEMEND